MPTYLVHGFRWSRQRIRIHIAYHDLEDGAAEWIVLPRSAVTLLNSFYTICDFLPPSQAPRIGSSNGLGGEGSTPQSPISPNGGGMRTADIEPSKSGGLVGKAAPASSPRANVASANPNAKVKFNDWSVVKLVEQYDPEDESGGGQPFAYVADHVCEVKLSLDIAEEMKAYEERDQEIRAKFDAARTTPLSPAANGGGDGKGTNDLSDAQGHNRTMSGRDLRRLSRQVGWFEKLRDTLEQTAEIRWYVVRCDDDERVISTEKEAAAARDEEEQYWDEEDEGELETVHESEIPKQASRKLSKERERDRETDKGGSLRGFFGRNKEKGRRKL